MKKINQTRKALSNAEYRFLGKGLNYCPKPKRHDQTRCFEFTRKLKLREFFAAIDSDENDNEQDTCDNRFEYIKRKIIIWKAQGVPQ